MAGDPSKFNPETLATYGARKSVEYLSKKTGKKFKFLIPIEIGANTLIPMLVAAQTGKKIIDGSGTPRSVPRLQDTKLFTHGVSIAPVAFASDNKNASEAFFDSSGKNNKLINVDGVMRNVVESEPFNGTTGFAGFVMKGKKMKKAASLGTISKAMKLGETLNNNDGKNVFNKIQKFLNLENRKTYLLAQGNITKIESIASEGNNRMALNTRKPNSKTGFQFLSVTITDNNGNEWIVKAVNENLIAYKNKQVIALGPDLISYVNTEGSVFSNTNIKTGENIMLIGTQATPEMRDQTIVNDFLAALNMVGYKGEYTPIEQLQAE